MRRRQHALLPAMCRGVYAVVAHLASCNTRFFSASTTMRLMPHYGWCHCAYVVAAGKIQQLQAAYVLEKSCEHKGCEFVINTCVADAAHTAWMWLAPSLLPLGGQTCCSCANTGCLVLCMALLRQQAWTR